MKILDLDLDLASRLRETSGSTISTFKNPEEISWEVQNKGIGHPKGGIS